jgi:hypothetical protein
MHSRITVRVGTRQYTLDIPCPGVAVPPAANKGKLERLQAKPDFSVCLSQQDWVIASTVGGFVGSGDGIKAIIRSVTQTRQR